MEFICPDSYTLFCWEWAAMRQQFGCKAHETSYWTTPKYQLALILLMLNPKYRSWPNVSRRCDPHFNPLYWFQNTTLCTTEIFFQIFSFSEDLFFLLDFVFYSFSIVASPFSTINRTSLQRALYWDQLRLLLIQVKGFKQ